jgi:hypothetical protein
MLSRALNQLPPEPGSFSRKQWEAALSVHREWLTAAGGLALAGLSGLACFLALQAGAAGLSAWLGGFLDGHIAGLLAGGRG